MRFARFELGELGFPPSPPCASLANALERAGGVQCVCMSIEIGLPAPFCASAPGEFSAVMIAAAPVPPLIKSRRPTAVVGGENSESLFIRSPYLYQIPIPLYFRANLNCLHKVRSCQASTVR